MSMMKNLQNLTSVAPRRVITWDKMQRIVRNKEIWADKDSIVHRLPMHYQERYWRNFVLADATPVHYIPPTVRYQWDTARLVQVEREDYPIIPLFPPEADRGLWGGEGVVKGYCESKPFTRKKVLPRFWIPKFWFPLLQEAVLYSEVLDRWMQVCVTRRALLLIDEAYGLDMYLLRTTEIDLRSRLGCKLKREILIALARGTYYPDDARAHDYIAEKYAEFVLPVDEAEWVALDLNEACRKQQDIEDEARAHPVPMKVVLEEERLRRLKEADEIEDEDKEQVDEAPSSVFDRMLGRKKS